MDKKEYIEREAIIQEIKEAKNDFSPTVRPIFDVATHLVSHALAADVVEVVRCKDCEYRDKHGVCEKFRQFFPEDNFYCEFGERKDNNEKSLLYADMDEIIDATD